MRNQLHIIMDKDFLQQLEFTGFTARIKRLSDGLLYDAITVYKQMDKDIEPNWHLVFLLLKNKGEMSVTEIAKQLGFSHPAVIKIVNKMKAKGYLEGLLDEKDSRRTLLRLTEKSKEEIPHLEQNWNLIQAVIQEFIDKEFLDKLTKVEECLRDKSFLERINLKLEEN